MADSAYNRVERERNRRNICGFSEHPPARLTNFCGERRGYQALGWFKVAVKVEKGGGKILPRPAQIVRARSGERENPKCERLGPGCQEALTTTYGRQRFFRIVIRTATDTELSGYSDTLRLVLAPLTGEELDLEVFGDGLRYAMWVCGLEEW